MLGEILLCIFCVHYASLNELRTITVPCDDYWNFIGIPVQPTQTRQQPITIENCKIAIGGSCPDPEISYYLYSKNHPYLPERIAIGASLAQSNISESAFNPQIPTKVIVHGYNSGMFLNVLQEIRRQYLLKTDVNIFFVDWSAYSQGPCYPAAVWNTRHAGKCATQLVERVRELGATDIHLIGFSLGAHVPNYIANELRPYKVPRITGLDPAMPGFITVSNENKLDKGDAEFVDVIHTNAFIQGKAEECGHVDFYLNGGTFQPGCWAESRFFACNHHRAPQYFAESINTEMGFWGWPCPSFVAYLLGQCPPKEPQILMGAHVDGASKGVHLVITNSVTPFAVGKFTGPAIEILLKSESGRRKIIDKFKFDVLDLNDADELFEIVMHEKGKISNKRLADDIFKSSQITDFLKR